MLRSVELRPAAPSRAPAVEHQELSRAALLAYALTVWPMTTAQLSLPFIAPYYTQTFGLTLTFAGMVLTAGRLLDVVSDLTVAWSSDRTRTRWGRRKPWVVVGLCLYIPASLALFVPPTSVSPLRYIFLVMMFFLAWTTAFVPYLAQGTELSNSYQVKNRINIMQSAVMLIALLTAFTVPFLLIDPRAAFIREVVANALDGWLPASAVLYLRSPAPTGTHYFASAMLAITALSLAPLIVALPAYVLKVKERALGPSAGHGSLFAALRNPVFLRFALGYVFLMAGYMGRGGLMPIVLGSGMHLPDSYLFFMMLMFASSLLITPVWGRLLQRFERVTCIIAAALIEATGLTMLFLIPDHSILLTSIAFVIMGLPGQTLLMVPILVAADASDYSRWKTRFDSRAIHVSLCSLITKLGTVFAGLTVWLAGVAGLDLSRSEQPAHIVQLLKVIGLGIPVLCLIVGCLIMLRFPLSRRRHAAIRARLDLRDRLGQAAGG
jgi:Na+/melibiose symporter-like transporter